MNLSSVFRTLGFLGLGFTSFMVFPLILAIFEWQTHLAANLDTVWTLCLAMLTGWSIGAGLLYIGKRGAQQQVFLREALAIVSLGWMLAGLVGALPFYFSRHPEFLLFTDCYFESISGLTTTGSSILTNIESVPQPILLWRSMIQWLGGMGIVVLFVAILPIIGIGGRALFKSEVPGPITDGLTPRIKETALVLWKIYLVLTAAEILALWMCGMSLLDATNHSFTTMATGGYSTHSKSLGGFNNVAVEIVVIVFMVLAGINFQLYFEAIYSGWKKALNDRELQVYLAIMFFSTLCLAGDVLWHGPATSWAMALRGASFTSVSIMTTTGYGTADYAQWSAFSQFLLVLLMFIGGCGGSTGGGLKVIRIMILFQTGRFLIRRAFATRIVHRVKIGHQTIDEKILLDVLGYFFLMVAIFLAATLVLAWDLHSMPDQKNPLVTAFSAVAATLNNIGPGLEAVGPTCNFAFLSHLSKWVLCLCMLIGRLEIFAVAVLFMPAFWARK